MDWMTAQSEELPMLAGSPLPSGVFSFGAVWAPHAWSQAGPGSCAAQPTEGSDLPVRVPDAAALWPRTCTSQDCWFLEGHK